MVKVILLLLLVGMLSYVTYRRYMLSSRGVDMMNVYKLRFKGTPVFTTFRRFIKEHGIPGGVRIKGEIVAIEKEEDLYFHI